jgi:subtilisin family serine protease
MKFLILLFAALSFYVYPQDKYLIYFKDKGISKHTLLSKSSPYYVKAIKSLSPKSIERRENSMPAENLVTYEDIPINDAYIEAIEQTGAIIHHRLKWFNAVSAYIQTERINTIKNLSFVEKVEPVKKHVRKTKFDFVEPHNPVLNKFNNANTLDYGLSFSQLDLSDIPAIHSRGINGRNILIGLLDTGFDWQQHEALSNSRVIAEYDFVFNDNITRNEANDASTQHDHGTYVFSIVGGYSPGKLIGAAYDASYVLAKTEYVPTETHAEEDNYARALEWMDSIGVDISSSSLGYNEFDSGENSYTYSDMNGKTTIVTKAAELAFDRGIIVITSAGNEGNNSWRYITAPADGFNIIAVGAVNSQNQLATFSSRGPTYDNRIKPEIVTQGVSVYGSRASTVDQYSYANGTSSAAPIAAGISALLLSSYPTKLDNEQVRNILIETADQANSPDYNKGYGLSSALRALTFPVINYSHTIGTLMKRFQKTNIVYSSVEVFAKKSGEELYTKINTSNNNDLFSSQLLQFQNGEVVSFYFSYKDSNGVDFREPSTNKDYNFVYGSKKISASVSFTPENLTLEQNYPNPFNKYTSIVFHSPSVENVELTILNVIGEKIKTIFIGQSIIGKNEFTWNGKNDKGIETASGVYYYVLRVNNNFYAKKMVIVR